ncbi:MAG: heparan-alpha-glucosaminide N-acetyltransferase [Reinekea sp.]
MTTPTTRIHLIDQMRGIAIILMAVFHFSYDLSAFHFITFSMHGSFFPWFRFVIVTLFFLSVGAGLYLAHTPIFQSKNFWLRELKIAAGAVFITLSTFVMYPRTWVWFGVLHFIALASLIAVPFIRFPKAALITGICIFLLFNLTDWFNLHFLWQTLRQPLHLPPGTQDLTRLIPWLGMVLIGIYFGHVRGFGIKRIPLGILNKPVDFLSKHSLIFYIVHQAPLFGLAWLLNAIFH